MLARTLASCLFVLGMIDGANAQAPGPQARVTAGEGRVFQIRVETLGGPRVGTATLLRVVDGQGIFATCYHVLQGATSFQILDRAEFPGAVCLPEDVTGMIRGWNRDLALIRAKLRRTDRAAPVFTEAEWASPDRRRSRLVPDSDPSPNWQPVEGVALGFPKANTRDPLDVPIAMLNVRDMRGVNLIRDDAAANAPAGPDTNLNLARVRMLSRDLTFPGMSGGLVVDDRGRFGGIVFGQGKDLGLVGLSVPASDVVTLLEGAGWRPFEARSFAPRSALAAGFGQAGAIRILNESDWSSIDSWIAALEDRPAYYLEQFQEYLIGVSELRARAEQAPPGAPLTLSATLGNAPGEPGGEVRLMLNGGETRRLEPGLAVPLPLRSGENLMVLTRASDSDQRSIVLNETRRPLTLDVTVFVGEVPALHLRRVLPAAVKAYPVFVTLVNDDPPPAPGVGGRGLGEINGRLAVRLDELSGLLSAVPLEMPVKPGDRRGSYAQGTIKRGKGRSVRMTRRSNQTVRVEIDTAIDLEEARVRFAGLSITARKKTLNGTLRGLLQFPEDLDDLAFFSPRTLGVDSHDPLLVRIPLELGEKPAAKKEARLMAVPLGPFLLELGKKPAARQEEEEDSALDIDFSGALRLALNCYLNNQLLKPTESQTEVRSKMREALQKAGGMGPAEGLSLVPRRASVLRDPEGDDWFVVGFSVSSTGTTPTRGLGEGDWLPEANRRSTTALELLVLEPPKAAVAAVLPGRLRENPLADRPSGIKEGTWADTIRVSIARGPIVVPEGLPAVELPDVKNLLPDALRKVMIRSIEARSVDVSAVLTPAAVPLSVREFLPPSYLDGFQGSGEGRLKLEATVPAAGFPRARLDLIGPPIAFDAPRPLLIEGKVKVLGSRLTLGQVALRCGPSDRVVRGQVSGSIACESAEFDGRTLSNVAASFEATVDSAAPEKVVDAKIVATAGLFRTKLKEAAKIPSSPIFIWLRPDGTPKTDLASILFDD